MKQKDVLLIVVIVVVAAVISLFLSKRIFVTPADRQQQVEVVPSISENFNRPSRAYFNSSSKDPTQFITIGPSANANPF
jgi:hypothetical protein